MAEIEEKSEESEESSITIDFANLYKFKKEDLAIDISTTNYSNLAYMQVGHRDVYIDFLEMPGIKRDGKMVINGVRIFMSHAAAKALADSLSHLLEDVHRRGKMETYSSEGIKKTTTKVDRTVKEMQT
ncbi:MAG: DUF3467 domain-containing protein [Euryarchaeota archaeon]|nr:DUF3467 domain-containing protein [Euryarchaeota archaeon]